MCARGPLHSAFRWGSWLIPRGGVTRPVPKSPGKGLGAHPGLQGPAGAPPSRLPPPSPSTPTNHQIQCRGA